MRTRLLLLFAVSMLANIANASMQEIEMLFKNISESDYVTGQETYVNPAKEENEKSERVVVTYFSVPLEKQSLIDDIKKAFTGTDDAFYKVIKNGMTKRIYVTEISNGYSVNMGGLGKNLVYASYKDQENANYRYVYSMEWQTKGELIEGRLLYVVGKKSKASYGKFAGVNHSDNQDVRKTISQKEIQDNAEKKDETPKVFINEKGLIAITNLQGASLYATTGKECRVVVKGVEVKALKTGNVKINGKNYALTGGKAFAIASDGKVEQCDKPDMNNQETNATLSVDKSLNHVYLNGMLLFSHAVGYELHNINGAVYVKSKKNLINAEIPDWMTRFDYYCRGINRNLDKEDMLLAYLKRLNWLTENMSEISGYERKIVSKKIGDLFFKLQKKEDLPTAVVSQMHQITQNIDKVSE